jgi:hypothetical protein
MTAARTLVSPLEKDYAPFDDQAIEAADSVRRGRLGAGFLMRDMNRMHQVVAGLGVVLRIVAGNSVLEDEFDTGKPGSAPPLSRAAVSMLTAMAASMCEEMCEGVERRANDYNSEVQS